PAAREAGPSLLKCLADRTREVRQRAATALARIGPAMITPLIRQLGKDAPEAREAAATALAEFGAEAEPAVQSLLLNLKDDNRDVREASARALGRIGPAASLATSVLGELL